MRKEQVPLLFKLHKLRTTETLSARSSTETTLWFFVLHASVPAAGKPALLRSRQASRGGKNSITLQP